MIPALLVAAGLLLAAIVSSSVPASFWPVLVGPLVLAGCLVVAGYVGRRLDVLRRGVMPAVLLLAASCVAASVVIALRDPARVAESLPFLGAASAWPLLMRARGSRACCW